MSDWTKGAVQERDTDSILDTIESYRSQLRDAAYNIRHCDCDRGFIHGTKMLGEREYPCVSECSCFIQWKQIHREMMQKVRKWEKRTGGEYAYKLSPEMTYFARPRGERPTREAVEQAQQAVSRFETGVAP